MGARKGRLSSPWLRFHGVGRADVYIIIRVRASCCGESALNPPTSPPIPRRRPSPTPAQRHALPEHFLTPAPTHTRSPTQRRRTPAGCAMHSSPTPQHIPRRRSAPTPAQRHALPEPSCHVPAAPTHTRRLRHAFLAALTTHSPPKTVARPRTATRPSRALPPAHAAPTHARRPHDPFPAEDLRSPPHSDTPFPSTSAPPRSPDARPRSPDARPQTVRCIPRRPHHPFPAEGRRPPPHSDTPLPEHFRSPRADALPQAARCIPRRPHNTFPTEDRHPPPQRRPASPSVPLRAQKNGTAQWMCDAECLGRPSLRSVIGVGEPRAVRRRCGALAWRVGLRPQPWALRSRRCGRVLRA